jgi:hypothetical protein
MKTYQQYQEDKLKIQKESFILAYQTMKALYVIDPDERDSDWSLYAASVSSDVNRLADRLPTEFVKRIYEENQS